jgi:hypothetical protein
MENKYIVSSESSAFPLPADLKGLGWKVLKGMKVMTVKGAIEETVEKIEKSVGGVFRKSESDQKIKSSNTKIKGSNDVEKPSVEPEREKTEQKR